MKSCSCRCRDVDVDVNQSWLKDIDFHYFDWYLKIFIDIHACRMYGMFNIFPRGRLFISLLFTSLIYMHVECMVCSIFFLDVDFPFHFCSAFQFNFNFEKQKRYLEMYLYFSRYFLFISFPFWLFDSIARRITVLCILFISCKI